MGLITPLNIAMNATAAPSAAPTQHLKVWSDGSRIYVEIPGAAGKEPYITAYDYNYRGIDLMLSLLGLHRIDYDYQGKIPASYKGSSNLDVGTATQQSQADAILARMGLLK